MRLVLLENSFLLTFLHGERERELLFLGKGMFFDVFSNKVSGPANKT